MFVKDILVGKKTWREESEDHKAFGDFSLLREAWGIPSWVLGLTLGREGTQ